MSGNRVGLNSLIYLVSNLLNSLIPFLLLPSYTSHLATEEVGILTTFDSSLLLLVPIIMFGISGVLSVEYFKDEKHFSSRFTSSIAIPTLIFMVLMFGNLFTYFLFDSVDLLCGVVAFMLTIAYFQVITQIRLVIFQAEGRSIYYLYFQAWIIISSVFLTIQFVIQDNLGWEGRILALLLTYSVSFILSVYLFIKEERLKFELYDKHKVIDSAKTGYPLVFHALGMLVILFFDRYLLAYYWGFKEVGVYAVAMQVGMGISLLQNSFAQAWGPYLFKLLSKKVVDKVHIVKLSYLFSFFIFVASFLLIVLAPFVFKVFIGEGYEKSIELVGYIAVGFAFTGLYKLFVNYIFYVKNTKLLAKLAIMNAMVNVCLNLILVPVMGATGAAISFLLSMVVVFVGTAVASQKVYPMPWFKVKTNSLESYE